MKRFSSAILAAAILVCCAFPVVSSGASESSTDISVPDTVTGLEKITGVLGNVFGHFLKIITFTDESRIKKAEPRDAAGEKSSENLFSGEAEQTLSAETWRLTELNFESAKSYDDPFNDVTLDMLLYGNGRLYRIPAFWDGENTWRVRFVCPAEVQNGLLR